MLTARQLIGGVTAVLSLIQDWEENEGTRRVWRLLLALVMSRQKLTREFQKIHFLSPRLIIFRCNRGIVVYTMRDLQINLNLLVLKTGLVFDLLEDLNSFLSTTHPGHAVNMTPALPQTESDKQCVMYRRVVPASCFIDEMELQGDEVRCHGTTPVLLRVNDARALSAAKPITRMSPTDPECTLYWYRFECGSLVMFRNPFVHTLVEPFPFPDPFVDRDEVLNNAETSCAPFLRSLDPVTLDDTRTALAEQWIPRFCRKVSLFAACFKFNISDTLIDLSGDSFGIGDSEKNEGVLLNQFVLMSGVMRMKSSNANVLNSLVSFLVVFGSERWNDWAKRSLFVHSLVSRSSSEVLFAQVRKCHLLLVPLERILAARCGFWTRSDAEKARFWLDIVKDASTEASAQGRIRSELHRLCERAEKKALNLETTQPVKSALLPSRPTRCAPKTTTSVVPSLTSETTSNVAAPPLQTHRSRFASLSRKFSGLEMDLIGSGLLMETGDLDVVVTIGAATLRDAVDHVMHITGWEPQHNEFEGDRLVILSGSTEDGVRIDAQVWRGDKTLSFSERRTASALGLAKRLSLTASEENLSGVRLLHEWCNVTNCKGHLLCRLPGVAVTCGAITLNRFESQATLETVLRHFRDALHCTAPRIDFDALEATSRTDEVCSVALNVVVDRENCASRMSTGTTRHLCEILLFALSLPVSDRLSSVVYGDWRRANLVTFATVRPRNNDVVARYLASSLASLDEHPVISSIFVEETAEGILCVRGALDMHADVQRYGFSASDTIVAGDTVSVRRRSRSYPLATSPRMPTVASREFASSVCDMLPIEVPNVPTLTCDVLARFDPRFWEY
jgi:hypothetical protein